MDIGISAYASGELSDSELRELRDWLARDQPRPAQLAFISSPAEPGTMGPVADTLQVAVGTGGAITVLAGSIATWLSTRKQDISLRLVRQDGESLELSGRVVQPEAVIE